MYKPGNVSAPPPLVAPHQPRLDWQMWFAALGHHTQSPWFTSFVYRLLQGKKEGELERCISVCLAVKQIPYQALEKALILQGRVGEGRNPVGGLAEMLPFGN